jgi:hypothetical protein
MKCGNVVDDEDEEEDEDGRDEFGRTGMVEAFIVVVVVVD